MWQRWTDEDESFADEVSPNSPWTPRPLQVRRFFDMLGVFAEFETNCVASARSRGSPRRSNAAPIAAARQDRHGSHQASADHGLSPTEIDRELRISRGTVYKARAGTSDIA